MMEPPAKVATSSGHRSRQRQALSDEERAYDHGSNYSTLVDRDGHAHRNLRGSTTHASRPVATTDQYVNPTTGASWHQRDGHAQRTPRGSDNLTPKPKMGTTDQFGNPTTDTSPHQPSVQQGINLHLPDREAIHIFWSRFRGKGRKKAGLLLSLKNIVLCSWLNIFFVFLPLGWIAHFQKFPDTAVLVREYCASLSNDAQAALMLSM